MTAIATGSYAGINIIGPFVAPTPNTEIAAEQKFRKGGFSSVNNLLARHRVGTGPVQGFLAGLADRCRPPWDTYSYG
jgi:hypothetical protein